MEKVTIKLSVPPHDDPATVTGYVDEFRGFRFVVHRHHIYKNVWTVSEYFTGLNCSPSHATYKTIKEARKGQADIFNSLTPEQVKMLNAHIFNRRIN